MKILDLASPRFHKKRGMAMKKERKEKKWRKESPK